MAKGLSVKAAAGRLGTTEPTIRTLIAQEKLTASQVPWGARFKWSVDESSIEGFLKAHGRYDQRRRRSAPSVVDLAGRVAALEEAAQRRDQNLGTPTEGTFRQLEDALARIVVLEDALARLHGVAEVRTAADAARSEVIDHLLAALRTAEQLDVIRREGQAELEEIIAGFSRPGHLRALKDA
jgi:hypothetical protein